MQYPITALLQRWAQVTHVGSSTKCIFTQGPYTFLPLALCQAPDLGLNPAPAPALNTAADQAPYKASTLAWYWATISGPYSYDRKEVGGQPEYFFSYITRGIIKCKVKHICIACSEEGEAIVIEMLAMVLSFLSSFCNL